MTTSERSRFVDARAEPDGGLTLRCRGAVAASLAVGLTSSVLTPVAAPVDGTLPLPAAVSPSVGTADSVFELKPVAVGVAGVSDLTCGDDAGYRDFRAPPHALGWVGGGLVLAGVGVQFIPAPKGVMVGVVGSL